MAPGRVSVETSLGDWTLDKQGGDRTDTVLIGDTSVRIGLTDSIEAQVGWTPLGIVRERTGGAVDRATRAGDATLGIKANLRNPDGSGFSVAVQPFVTLPVGRAPVGARDWGAGLVVPLTYDLSKTVNLEITPEVDAAVDQDGRGGDEGHQPAGHAAPCGVQVVDRADAGPGLLRCAGDVEAEPLLVCVVPFSGLQDH